VIAEPSIRSGLYTSTVIGIWIPTIAMLAYQMNSPSFAPPIIWLESFSNTWLILAALIFSMIGYLSWTIVKLRTDDSNDQNILASIESVRWLLPARKPELKRFVLAVSPSAGICEEILYRGLLLGMLSEFMPISAAVILSSIAFAAPHLYQGVAGFIKTFILGAIFALIVVISNSLLLVVILHTVIDMYMGLISYIVMNRDNRFEQSKLKESVG